MENGWKIRVAEVEHDAVSLDVAEDGAKVEGLLRAASGRGEERFLASLPAKRGTGGMTT